jgi:hypothetical protein
MRIQRTYPNSDARTDDRWIVDLVLVGVSVRSLSTSCSRSTPQMRRAAGSLPASTCSGSLAALSRCSFGSARRRPGYPSGLLRWWRAASARCRRRLVRPTESSEQHHANLAKPATGADDIRSILSRSIDRAQARDKVRRNVVRLCTTPVEQPGRPSKAVTFAQAEALLAAAEGSRTSYLFGVKADAAGSRRSTCVAL